jgi:DNA modification methylase
MKCLDSSSTTSQNVTYAREIEMWAIDRLIPYARNARTHSDAQVAQIAGSIREFGFNNPILIDSASGVIAGHGRLLAARKLELREVPVIILDHLSETEKRAYILADNRLAELAGWDDELLRLELASLSAADFPVDLTGFSSEEFARLIDTADSTQGKTDEDAIPASPEKAVSRAGDLWLLGDHRLLCGDATKGSDLDHLMDGERADLIFTDPPYNVSYEGHTEQRLTIQGDSMSRDQFISFLAATFSGYRRIVAKHASLYVCHASLWQREFQDAIEHAGFEVRCQLIWAKNTFAWGFGRYKFQHEPIFYAHVAGLSDLWFGDKSQSTLWQENKPAANRVHPTAKPVELVERALINSSKPGSSVTDLFGGSGSTLIACERKGRRARMMEIDPIYCDVIVRRWEEYKGRQATLSGDGRRFSEIARERQDSAVEVTL